MVRYFYSWAPLVIVGTVVFLTLPWLGLIALMVFAFAALGAFAALAWAIVFVPYTLGRSLSHRLRGPSGANHTSSALSLAERKSG